MALYLGEDRIDASSPFGNAEYLEPINGASYSTITANVWECTGLTVTVPEGHVYIIQVLANYNNGRPYGIGVHTSNTYTSSYGAPPYHVQSPSSSEALNRASFFISAGTWYIYCKRAATGSNTYTVRALDFTI